MIKRLSEKTAEYILRQEPSADYEVLVYGYELLYQEIAVTLIALLLALPFGLLLHVLVVLGVFHLIRRYAGGAHASSQLVCTIVSVTVLYVPALVFVKTSAALPPLAMAALFLLDLSLLLAYAPADTAIKPVQTPSKRRSMKIKSILVLTAVFLLAQIPWLRARAFSDVAAMTVTLVCLMTHPLVYRLLGCSRSVPQ